jgi:hypothetical protein
MPRPSAETLAEAKDAGATHVIVVCDTFSYEDYTVEVMPGDDLAAKRREYSDNMQRVMEVIPIQSEQEARLSKVNSELRELQEKYLLAVLQTNKGVQIQFQMTKKGTFVPAKKRKAR